MKKTAAILAALVLYAVLTTTALCYFVFMGHADFSIETVEKTDAAGTSCDHYRIHCGDLAYTIPRGFDCMYDNSNQGGN